MKIHIYNKRFHKETKQIKNAIVKALNTLYERISAYERQGTDFNHIFNDDKVKYDKHGQFYTFKCKRNDVQLRLLYAYFEFDGEPTLLLADYYIKKQDNKEYIRLFDSVNNSNPLVLMQAISA